MLATPQPPHRPEPPLLDQRFARAIVRPLATTFVHPNMFTTTTLALGFAAAACFAGGSPGLANAGALLFMLAVFSDHLDGELARASGKSSEFGYYYDFIVGGAIYTMLFLGIGFGLAPIHGNWTFWLGAAAAFCNPFITVLRLRLDAVHGCAATEHPAFGWFNLEDIIYLIGPLTWALGVEYFFVPFTLGTIGYLAWTVSQYRYWFSAERSGRRPGGPEQRSRDAARERRKIRDVPVAHGHREPGCSSLDPSVRRDRDERARTPE